MSKSDRKKMRESGLLPARANCKAHSSRTGLPCNNPPMHGQLVCRMHGGATKASRERARQRLELEADPAAARIIGLAEDPTAPHAVRLAANKEILDRGGVVAKHEVEVTLGGWQDVVLGITSEVPDNALPGVGPGDYAGYREMNGLALDNVVEAVVISDDEA